MLRVTAALSRASIAFTRKANIGSVLGNNTSLAPFRLIHEGVNGAKANPVAVQMINYALSHARSNKSGESYAQGLLILEQCLCTQLGEGEEPEIENSRAMVLLALSTLLFESGNLGEAIEKLQRVQELPHSFLGIRVAAIEALVGLHLELGEDDLSSVLADKSVDLVEKQELHSPGSGFEAIKARAKAVKGLSELVKGNLESGESFFQGPLDDKLCYGSVALSYGEFLHASQNFSLAKEIYQNIIQGSSKNKDLSHPYGLAACNMTTGEVIGGAMCVLGQLEAHLGNFGDAEELLTRALTMTEECYGPRHPKVGVVLTCIGLMFRRKAILERSSSLLIQEGLYRRAIEMLKAPSVETESAQAQVDRRDIVAIARGAYAEVLSVQQNRKDEGEKMRHWAGAAWRNHRLSLAEAIEISDSSSKVPVIDARINRVL